MEDIKAIRSDLRREADPAKALLLSRFFKTGKGQYAEGDKFLGITVPVSRAIAGKHAGLSLRCVMELLRSPWHEERLCALLLMLERFRKGNEGVKRRIYELYLANTSRINNWDLVDLSAPGIAGEWLAGRRRRPLYRLARSRRLWERRIAVVACFAFLRRGESGDALAIAEMLLSDKHDLIHKAVGWLLREVGKRSSERALTDFLRDNYARMPRTALRYAIERFPLERRRNMLRGRF